MKPLESIDNTYYNAERNDSTLNNVSTLEFR